MMMMYSKILNVVAKVNWVVYLCCLIAKYFFIQNMQNKVLLYINSIGILYFIFSFPITIISMLVYLKKLRPENMKGSLLHYMRDFLLNFRFPENIVIIILLCHYFLSAIICSFAGVPAEFYDVGFLTAGLIYNFCIINMTYTYMK